MEILTRIKAAFHAAQKRNYTCEVCGREVFTGEFLCKSCFAEMPWNTGPYCPLCGRAGLEAGVCLECKERRLYVDRARSVWRHEEKTAPLVSHFKNGAKYLRFPFSERLEELCLSEFQNTDLLAYVPMTEAAEKRRGYNQSRLLARELSTLLNIPLYDGVKKIRETQAQKSLSRKEREENLRGCFHVSDRKGLRGKCVLVIDDTLTTGSTLSELSYVFKRAGASEVNALTLTSVERKKVNGKIQAPPRVHVHADQTPKNLI